MKIRLSHYTHLPDEIAKIIIARIYEIYKEKTVYVGRGTTLDLFQTKKLSYMVNGFVEKPIIEYRHFKGNGTEAHYFIKEEKQLEIKKILI